MISRLLLISLIASVATCQPLSEASALTLNGLRSKAQALEASARQWSEKVKIVQGKLAKRQYDIIAGNEDDYDELFAILSQAIEQVGFAT